MNKFTAAMVAAILTATAITPMLAEAGYSQRSNNRQESRADNRGDRQDNRADNRHDRQHDRSHGVGARHVVLPRQRHFRNIVVVRPHGHLYHGYGHFYRDDDAWKWLAFTAITLKILDNVNEEAQRAHEAAQVKATTAAVGDTITWHTRDASGQVMTVKEGTNGAGQTCREFQQEITVGGQTEQAYGTACLQPDGAWKIVS